MAERHDFPIIVGTEMNSPGNKFVDSFGTAELAPLVPVFLRGAHIIYGHSVLQRQSGLGYLSEWAKKTFLAPRPRMCSLSCWDANCSPRAKTGCAA